jgi:hypothetical protein
MAQIILPAGAWGKSDAEAKLGVEICASGLMMFVGLPSGGVGFARAAGPEREYH